MPSWRLLGLVVGSAERAAIAFARASALIGRDRMILIGMLSWPSAAGIAAGSLPNVDQVAERGRHPVRGGLPLMAAVPGLKFLDLDLRQPGYLVGARRPRTCAGAAMGDGPPIWIGNRHAPPGPRSGGDRGGQFAARGRVQDIKPGGFPGRVGQAQPAGKWNGQVYRPAQGRRHDGTTAGRTTTARRTAAGIVPTAGLSTVGPSTVGPSTVGPSTVGPSTGAAGVGRTGTGTATWTLVGGFCTRQERLNRPAVQQRGVHAGAQLLPGTGCAMTLQPAGERVNALVGGDHFSGRQVTSGDRRRAGRFGPCLDPLVLLCLLPPPDRRFRVDFHYPAACRGP